MTELVTVLPGIDFCWSNDHSFRAQGSLDAGIYSCRIYVTIPEEEWQRFYYRMEQHGNQGQMTGPWDFDGRDGSRPLMPSWWISINDHRIGLFSLCRPDAEAVISRELWGEFCFQVKESSPVTVDADLYAPFTLTVRSVSLEVDSRDAIIAQEWAQNGFAANWLHHTGRKGAWQELAKDMAGTEWEEFLKQACDVYIYEYKPPKTSDGSDVFPYPVDAIPSLAMCYHVLGNQQALEHALNVVKHYLGLPAWGRANEDGYGHNCDMFCAVVIKYMVVVLNWLGNELGDMKQKLVERLEKQIDIFLDLQLLHAQYWGGAIAQDHGYRSSLDVAFAAMGMLGWTDKTKEWLAFYIPRVQRSFAVLPEDGFIPFANYHKISLYGLDLADFAISYEFASGRKVINDVSAYRHSPDYLLSCLDEAKLTTLVCCTRGDEKDFSVGLTFLHQHVQQTQSEAASYLAGKLMAKYRDWGFRLYGTDRWVWKLYATLPFAILNCPDRPYNMTRPERPLVNEFPDGGAVNFRNNETGFAAAAYCLPPAPSFHALGTDLTNTDRLYPNPSNGSFSVAYEGEVLIQCAESGYRTDTRLGNVLTVDGEGQVKNHHFPGAVVTRRWSGERLKSVKKDENGGTARFELTPAYPEPAALLSYTRDLEFCRDKIILRDTIISLEEHSYEYYFHTYASRDVAISGSRITIQGKRAKLNIDFAPSLWEAEIGTTETVWAYGNEQAENEFQHIHFKSKGNVSDIVFDLTIAP